MKFERIREIVSEAYLNVGRLSLSLGKGDITGEIARLAGKIIRTEMEIYPILIAELADFTAKRLVTQQPKSVSAFLNKMRNSPPSFRITREEFERLGPRKVVSFYLGLDFIETDMDLLLRKIPYLRKRAIERYKEKYDIRGS